MSPWGHRNKKTQQYLDGVQPHQPSMAKIHSQGNWLVEVLGVGLCLPLLPSDEALTQDRQRLIRYLLQY